jgi:subtilisin family serine protease
MEVQHMTYVYSIRHRIALFAACVALASATLIGRPAAAGGLAQVTPGYFVPTQIIVSGLSAQVDAVILAVPGTSFRLQRIERTSLAYTDALPAAAPFPFAAGRTTLVMDAYRILDGTDVPEMVRLVNSEAQRANLPVYAEPNYAVGRPPVLATGDPWSVEADPWSVEADPQAGNPLAASAQFWQQWAFGRRGIELFSDDQASYRSVPFTGEGVRVGVFDTSPFALGVAITGTETVDWISPTLTLDVRHPASLYDWGVPIPAPDAGNHGLFVSGLVHAVAPKSDIRLVRVLDQYGQGDLYTLSREIHGFNRQARNDRGTLDGVVINLSLGVHPPPNAGMLGLPKDIVALQTAVQAADGFGTTVIAAAGNDSDQLSADALQLPASYSAVLGIAGSSAQRGRSCFSNAGDVAAPGGNGVGGGCAPPPACGTTCADMLLGLVRPGPGESGYAYWPGTSFSTPLATGVAAVLLDARDGKLTSQQVREAVQTSALPPLVAADAEDLGAGIINLGRAVLPHRSHLPALVRGP